MADDLSDDCDLIAEIQRHPIIWDSRLKDYKNKIKKECAWMMIADRLHQDIDKIMYRWQNLRKLYSRKKRTVKSGDEANSIKKPWPLAAQMSFLAPVVISRKIINNDVPKQDAADTNIKASTSFIHHMTEPNDFEHFNSVMGSDEENEVIAPDIQCLTQVIEKAQDNSNSRTDTPCSSKSVSNNVSQPITLLVKKRKRDVADELLDFMKNTSSVLCEKEEDDPDKNFLLSLLPDLKQLNR
ncbi:hypothetical protein X975_21625, partial [Stegodyphus mimosarum]